jgi:hypothetical protein
MGQHLGMVSAPQRHDGQAALRREQTLWNGAVGAEDVEAAHFATGFKGFAAMFDGATMFHGKTPQRATVSTMDARIRVLALMSEPPSANPKIE